MAYNPLEHLIRIKDKNYLTVQQRVLWLRDTYPQAIIETTLLSHDISEGFALFRAKITITVAQNEHGPVSFWATASGSETRSDWKDYIEKAETKAVGRAAALIGFGTQFATDLEEGGIVDSPSPAIAPPSAGMPRVKSNLEEMLNSDEEGARILLTRTNKKTIYSALQATSPEEKAKLLTWLKRRSAAKEVKSDE